MSLCYSTPTLTFGDYALASEHEFDQRIEQTLANTFPGEAIAPEDFASSASLPARAIEDGAWLHRGKQP